MPPPMLPLLCPLRLQIVRGGISEARRQWLGDTPLTIITDPSTHRLLKFEEHEAGK